MASNFSFSLTQYITEFYPGKLCITIEVLLWTVVVASNFIDNKLLHKPCLEVMCVVGMAFVCGCDPHS